MSLLLTRQFEVIAESAIQEVEFVKCTDEERIEGLHLIADEMKGMADLIQNELDKAAGVISPGKAALLLHMTQLNSTSLSPKPEDNNG